MRYTQHFALVAIGAFAVSCSSIQNISIPKGVDTSVNIPAKKVFTEQEIQTWSHADLETDSIPGISLAKAYEFLKGKKSVPVIVAVTDSGTDITHEDLKSKVWTNPGEIAGNGIDDDKNGFVDDMHGWNFLGDTYDETLEITRLYRKLKPKYEGKERADIPVNKRNEFDAFKDLEEDYKTSLEEAKQMQVRYTQYQKMLEETHLAMQKLTGKKEYTLEDVKQTTPVFDYEKSKKEMTVNILESGSTIAHQLEQLEEALDYYTSKVNTYYNINFDGRVSLGDDPYKMKTKFSNYKSHSALSKKPSQRVKDVKESYGDNNVKDQGDDEIHGTHVSGIILADRTNEIGVKGVAENALLMAVRVVPNGDEYDKDVALGIKYAVDNGAKVINTSFGKGYSPKAKWVYDAIRYAEKHDVLIVNAAGNDAEDIDRVDTFPKDVDASGLEISDNFLTVGASARFYNENLLASFSNYGKTSVDVFAPGYDIYNTIINNEYKMLSGTSMASPATAGVAVLIRSYFPELSAAEVKQIIMNSGTLINFKVLLPGGEGKKVKLSDICKSGRIVNAYNAVKMAQALVNQKK